MLPSLKKPSDKPAAALPAWHPNFRNFDRLPDTKAVRTAFFVNGLAVFVALSLAIYTGYREYRLHVLVQQHEDARRVIADSRDGSDRAVALYRKFQEEEKKVAALAAFMAPSRLLVSDFLLQLGASQPPVIKLSGVEYRPLAVLLRGSIEGAPDEASGHAAAYVDSLKAHPDFIPLFETVNLMNIVRDPGTGQLRFEIEMKFKSNDKPAAPAAKGGRK